MRILGIIPARYASTRFPAKALADLGGKTMIQRVYEQCVQASSLAQVVVATDHEAIVEEVARFGGQSVMTSNSHPSGTDRCAEALAKQGRAYTHAINIQGDEPFINPAQIDLLAGLLAEGARIATLMHPISTIADLNNPNVVKVVAGQDGHALYFSRQAVPYLRDATPDEWLEKHVFYRHLGIYAFEASALEAITQLPEGELEQCEKLEQLRWLEAGYRIRISPTVYDSVGIDTPADLKVALSKLKENG